MRGLPKVCGSRSLSAFCATAASTAMAAAQDYPTRPITMIVPFPAGGATDTLARFLAEQMRPLLGQTVVIENAGGAAGSIGVGRAVRSPADGYTLSIGTSTTHMLTGGLYTLPFDLMKDLEPIIEIGSEPLLIVGKSSLPADDLKGLIAWLKANPDKASVGIAGVGATGHLTGIAFQKATGTKFQFVPYRGNAPAMQDLLAGQIDFMIEPSSNFRSLLATKSVKPFAITGEKRLPASPDIPTADEAGMPGFFATLWYGLWVPKGTPKDIIAKLNATMVAGAGRSEGAQAFRRSRHPGRAARPAIAGSAARVPEGRGRALVADHQGVRHQAGVGAPIAFGSLRTRHRFSDSPVKQPCRHHPPPGLAFGEPDDRLQRVTRYSRAFLFIIVALEYWVARSSPIKSRTGAGRRRSNMTFAISPHEIARGLFKVTPPLQTKGAGKTGCALHPRSRVQRAQKKRTRAYRFSGSSPAFPAQWFYGLFRALPGDRAFLPPSPPAGVSFPRT